MNWISAAHRVPKHDNNHPTCIWIRSQRGSRRSERYYSESTFAMIQRSAEKAGFALLLAEPEDVVVRLDRSVQVTVHDVRLDPQSAFFHIKTPQSAAGQIGYRNVLDLAAVLQASQFHATIPWDLNVRSDDKLCSLLTAHRLGLRTIRTSRVGTRQLKSVPPAAGFDDLRVGKPSRWHGGYGVVDLPEAGISADTFVQLMSATETPALFQERIADVVSDTRIYLDRGTPCLALVRSARPGQMVANVTSGSSAELAEPPQELAFAAQRMADEYRCTWLGVDFLVTGDGTPYLSEVEVDAGTVPYKEATEMRAHAYYQAFLAWRSKSQAHRHPPEE